MIDRTRPPSRRDLRVFGFAFAVVFGLLGALVMRRGGPPAASAALWAIGGLGTLAYAALPAVRWPLWRAWMAVFYPVGWLVSNAMLVLTYFLVFTPIGLVVRLGDPLRRRLEPEADSYWTARSAPRDPESYFRQY